MIVTDIDITRSPLAPDRTCLRGTVVSDGNRVPPQVYWIDVPNDYAAHLTESGNPWLALLAPFAVSLGETLRITRPVDRQLYDNVHELMRIWKCWYPRLDPIEIEADFVAEPSTQAPRATAALFSGGVDAWFTLLTHGEDSTRPDRMRIDDLLCIWGLDVSLEKPREFAAMRDTLAEATAGMGVRLVELGTNLHQTNWWQGAKWGPLAHGSGLASMAHALEHRYERLLIPSTHRYDDLVPWGSHPLTDPLLSTSHTRIIHDGAAYSRVEKTECIAGSDAALRSLQVCWDTQAYQNCEACTKCYRTMMTLHLLGVLDRCPRFSGTIDVGKVARMFSRTEGDRAFLREVRELALAKGRTDIAHAIRRSFKHSHRLERQLRWTQKLGRARFLGRLQKPLERRILEGSITG